MDDILTLLKGTAPEYGGGMTNHAPMAAEALCHLGLSKQALKWAEAYKKKNLNTHFPTQQNILAEEWQEHLGRRNYFDGWNNLFRKEIESMGWEQTLRLWIPRLLPGIVSAAAHGVLRTAHAVRSLENNQTALRRDELCLGLAYWASTFQTLPEKPYSGKQKKASEAIMTLGLIPLAERQYYDQISDGFAQLSKLAGFPSVINMLEIDSGFNKCLDDILKTFVRIYMCNSDTSLFPAIHAVTGPASLQLLEKYMGESDKNRALKYAWQASAALHMTFDTRTAMYENKDYHKTPDYDELLDAAIRSEDEHAMKFTEVCFRLSTVDNEPIYKLAAADATARLISQA